MSVEGRVRSASCFEGKSFWTKQIQTRRARRPTWPAACSIRGMTLHDAVDRVSGDFAEMPGLELTLAQAARLWNMDTAACRAAIDTLVRTGFL
jgi:hypothetical protein